MDERIDLTPWRDLGITGGDINKVPSMISADESLYLHWLARCRYTGEGEIVDGGALLGGSTVAFAEGLRLNDAVGNKVERIHSYDLFEYTPWLARLFRQRKEPEIGASLLPMFLENIKPWQASVKVYPGDILNYSWSKAPIEILFVDVAKSWEIQRHLLREFFPSLIPGVSIVVQQDFFFVSCYWIHLVMESLSEYFRPIHMPTGPTLGFQVVKAIPAHLLHVDYEHAFTKAEAVALMDRSLLRFERARRLIATTAKVSLLLAYRDVTAAREVVESIRTAPDFSDAVRIDFEKADERVARAEAQGRAA